MLNILSKKMNKIAITGGIGSGKSTVCKVLENYLFPVYYSDDRAKFLMNNNEQVINDIKAVFGNDIYSNNKLNKKALASIIFNDKDSLKTINSIVHPAVIKDFNDWCLKQISNTVFFECAILFEANLESHFSKVLCVFADDNTRIDRVMKRENCSKESVEERLKNQLNQDYIISKSDFCIDNSKDSSLLSQIDLFVNSL